MSKPASFRAVVTLAMTGASGAQYGLRLLEQLIAQQCRVYLLLSQAAEVVINTETSVNIPDGAQMKGVEAQQAWLEQQFQPAPGQVTVFGRNDWFAPVASGASPLDAMVLCPASGGSLSAIAHGASNNLIERAADVVLKERRKLIVVPRETPYSQIHLENMLRLTQMGAVVLPASPGFYQNPSSIEDLVDFVVARILDQLSLPQTLIPRWGS